MMGVGKTAKTRATRGRRAPADRSDPLAGRLGLSVPYEWWPSAPLLKSFEAAGFALGAAPLPAGLGARRPPRLHSSRRSRRRGAGDDRAAAVVHAPGGMRVGSRAGDRAFEGLLSYAAEIGAAQVVYHALALPEGPATEADLAAETRSLARLAARGRAARGDDRDREPGAALPGPRALSAIPLSVARPRSTGSAPRGVGSASTSATPT